MSRRHIPLLLAALLGGAAQAADCTPPEGFTPATSPVPLQDISKSESKHRVALLNIWAVWCAPCRKELPLLDAIAQDPGAPLDIITINLGDDPEQIGKIYDELHITALPRDNHGDVAHAFVGDEDVARRVVEADRAGGGRGGFLRPQRAGERGGTGGEEELAPFHGRVPSLSPFRQRA